MKKQQEDVRSKMVVLRLNDAELKQLTNWKQQTTEKDTSSYLRKLALHKPVTVKYRNQSADDFLLDMLSLKKELNAIGNNFNQAVHKLHLLDKIPEFRNWIMHYDSMHRQFIQTTELIKSRINELYEQWLLK